MDTIRIFLADDHAGIRKGLRSLLTFEEQIEIVGESDNGLDALDLIGQLSPDIVLLDVTLPPLGGIEVARRLQASGSPVRVLFLSASLAEDHLSDARASNARGYMIKDEVPEQLIPAIISISRGEQWWSSPASESWPGKPDNE